MMNIVDAVVARMNELRQGCREEVSDKALRIILRKDCETISLKSIQSMCELFDIDVRTFFDSNLFTKENLGA